MNIKSSSSEWLDLSDNWYGTASDRVNSLYSAIESAQNAVEIVNAQGDIGSLDIQVTVNDIEEHNEKRRRVVSFCNAIHYEMSELVDNPFCVSMSETCQQAYDLNPSDMKVTTGKFLWMDTESSLTELISYTYIDEKLKADFDKRYKELDLDKPSLSLKEAIKEAEFWRDEFEKSAECQRIAEEVFTDEVRMQWTSMKEEERKNIVEDYANRVGQVLYGERTWWDKLWGDYPSIVESVGYDASRFGVSRGNGKIAINDSFISSPTKNYSADKVIDTLTHEIRHQYQEDVINNPNKFAAPQNLVSEWNEEYISYSVELDNYLDYYKQPVEADAKAFAALSRPE